MKKILIFGSFIIILIFCAFFSNFSLSDLISVNYREEMKSVNNFGFVTEEHKSKNHILYKVGGEVVGECVTINYGKEKLNQISDKLGLMIVKKYMVENTEIIEGFSAKLKYKNNNDQANVQIAVKENEIVIGSPIIYGSY